MATVPGALGWGAAIVLAVAAVSAAVSLRWSGRWLGAGIVGTPFVLACTAFVAAAGVGPIGLAATVIVAGALAAVPVAAGLMHQPGVARTGGAWQRQLLDGLLVGSSLFLLLWYLALAPRVGVLHLGPFRPVVVAATVLSCAATGLAAVVATRAEHPRHRVGVTATALVLLCAAPLALVVPLANSSGWFVAAVALDALGCAALAWSHRAAAPALAAPDPDEPERHTSFGPVPTFWAVLVAVAGTLAQLVREGGLDTGGAVVVLPLAILLGLRAVCAIKDLRGYAERLAESESHFRRMAFTDPLTGLGNRRRLRRALEDLTDRAGSTLLMVDLDGFKDINDMYGHAVGDAVLVETAERLRTNLRSDDLAVRLAGDEFAVLLTATPDEGRLVAERLLRVLNRAAEPDGLPRLYASVGVAGCSSARDVDGMMRHADLALRFAKQNGKRRVELFDTSYEQWRQRRLAIERELRGALERDELTLVYQPVVALPSTDLVGLEALVRWTHPTLGPLSPADFVPVAEESGLIVELGQWVRHQACRQLSAWLADGHDIWMAVNVSVRELHVPEFVPQVVEALRAHHIPPDHLTLELTEHQVAQDVDELAHTLAALRETGVRIALDDFGAGYSSLGQLGRLAVDVLKIDRALVVERVPLVDVVVRLGQRLGLDVIAEGVEEVGQRSLVERARCRLGQGYLFGAPMPPERIEMLWHTPAAPDAQRHPAISRNAEGRM